MAIGGSKLRFLLDKSNKDIQSNSIDNPYSQTNTNKLINSHNNFSSTGKIKSNKRSSGKRKKVSAFKGKSRGKTNNISSNTLKTSFARKAHIHSITTSNTFKNKNLRTVNLITTTPILGKNVKLPFVSNNNKRKLQKATPTRYRAPKETSVGRQNLKNKIDMKLAKRHTIQIEPLSSKCTLFFCPTSFNNTYQSLSEAQQGFTRPIKDNILFDDKLILSSLLRIDTSAKISIAPSYTGDFAFYVAFLVILMITRSFRI